jgi:hypothetical protein
MALPTDPDTRLVRDATATALTEAGFPVATATLATKASRGGGPPFQRFGRRPIYRWGDAIGWARSQLGPVVSSTAELDALTPGGRKRDPTLRPSLPSADKPASEVGTAACEERRASRERRLCHGSAWHSASGAQAPPTRASPTVGPPLQSGQPAAFSRHRHTAPKGRGAGEHFVVTPVASLPVASMPLIVPRAQIITSQDHANISHSQGRGRVAVARRIDGRWTECTVPLGDIGYVASQHAGEPDIYLSQNRFFGRRRAIASLLQLNALFCDLDYYSLAPSIRHLRSEHVLPIALERLEEHRIPAPTVAISTGRGIALIWLHHPVPRYALSRWQACQSMIHRALSELGADPRALDAARVLRLVGTKNSKSNTLVMPLTDVGHVWVFDDLADEILPLKRADLERLRAAREKASMRRGLRSGVQPPINFTFVTLAEGRLTDLQRLLEYRFTGVLPAGQRDEWLFCAAVSMAYLIPAAALPHELAALAEQVAGWDEKETGARMSAVQDRARRAALGEKIRYRDQTIDPRYRLRTETIIARLAITEEEMIGAKLRHLVSGGIKRLRERERGARRRRAAGAVDRRTYEENSLSRLRPWDTEGVSRRTWERRRDCGNSLATSSVASPSGCMVVKPPGGALELVGACHLRVAGQLQGLQPDALCNSISSSRLGLS